ncbi:MAG: substrate-binding domain-containing protein, partial [Caecibacter massiliensis]|nr:substrate-binding domain-containing protein [Caecibacter massiliensis]
NIQDASCTVRILFDEPMYLLAAPQHPFALRNTVQISDLSGQTLILAEKGCSYRTAFENTLAQYHVMPAQVLEVESIFAIKKLVASNLGITYMPAMAVQDEFQTQTLVRLPWSGPDYHIKTLMIHKTNKWISPALKAFFELIKEYLVDTGIGI